MSEQSNNGYGMRQRVGLFLGPAVFLIILLLPAPEGPTPEAWAVAGVATFMAIWWVTEAVAIPVTALLPIILFPILKVGSIAEATRPFANPLIFLFKKGEFVLRWKDARKLPWEVLVLFGGGLSLAAAITSTGLAEWIGMSLSGLDRLPIVFLIMSAVLVIIFLTEITSNTATAAAFLPILASVAIAMGQNPLLLGIPAAVGASCAFMLPVATPPNAIVYGSGLISIPQMARAGFIFNILMVFIITGMMYLLLGHAFNVPWSS